MVSVIRYKVGMTAQYVKYHSTNEQDIKQTNQTCRSCLFPAFDDA